MKKLRQTILLVDDDSKDLLLLEMVFGAAELLREFSRRCAASLLVTCELPEMSGTEEEQGTESGFELGDWFVATSR